MAELRAVRAAFSGWALMVLASFWWSVVLCIAHECLDGRVRWSELGVRCPLLVGSCGGCWVEVWLVGSVVFLLLFSLWLVVLCLCSEGLSTSDRGCLFILFLWLWVSVVLACMVWTQSGAIPIYFQLF